MKTRVNNNNDDRPNPKAQKIVFTSAFDLLRNPLASDDVIKSETSQSSNNFFQGKEKKGESIGESEHRHHHHNPLLHSQYGEPAIKSLHFPFALKPDQIKAVEAWMANG